MRLNLCAATLLLAAALLFQPPTVGITRNEEPVRVPILMYHEVRHDRLGKDVITPTEFESDLRYLAAQGYTPVTMAALISYVDTGTPLPEKPIVLSFDDGYLSNRVYVLPLLKQYRVPIVLSVIGRSADEFTETPSDNLNYAHMSWPQLRELAETGLVELQNHSYDLHHDGGERRGCTRIAGESPSTYEQMLRADLDRLQEALYTHIGTAPTTFAYPYGLCCQDMPAILRAMGFRATLSCDFGVNLLTHDPDCLLGLRRICRSHGANLAQLLQQADRFTT